MKFKKLFEKKEVLTEDGLSAKSVSDNASKYNGYFSSMYGYGKSSKSDTTTNTNTDPKKHEEGSKNDNEEKHTTENTDNEYELRFKDDMREIKLKITEYNNLKERLKTLKKKIEETPTPTNKIEEDRLDTLGDNFTKLNKEVTLLYHNIINRIERSEHFFKLKDPEKYNEYLKNDKLIDKAALLKEESDLIFGDTLSLIEDIIAMNEAEVTPGNLNQALEHELRANDNVKDAKTPIEKVSALETLRKVKNQTTALKAQQAKENLDADKKDPVTGEQLKEASSSNPAVKSLENIVTNLTRQKERLDDRLEDAREKLNNRKGIIRQQVEAAAALESMNEGIRISPDLRKEKIIYKDLRKEKLIGKDLRDEKVINPKSTAKYDTMLYNGIGGEVLRYLITDEINNNNSENIEVAKIMKNDEETNKIINQIKGLLKKATKKELSYEEYTTLKVLKSNFRIAFNKAKKEYENRFNKR